MSNKVLKTMRRVKLHITKRKFNLIGGFNGKTTDSTAIQ